MAIGARALIVAAFAFACASPMARAAALDLAHGLQLENLSDDEQLEAGIPFGVRIARATDAAWSCGLRDGDLVVMVGVWPVPDVAMFWRLVARAGASTDLLVVRDHSVLPLALDDEVCAAREAASGRVHA